MKKEREKRRGDERRGEEEDRRVSTSGRMGKEERVRRVEGRGEEIQKGEKKGDEEAEGR